MTGPTRRATDAPATEAVILVIDDDPINLAVMADCLGDFGYTVLVADDCESGVQRAQYAHPDLILLDVMMPGTDGYETCRALKAIEATRDIPVMFMTALTETEHKIKAFEVGAVDYITKPFHREEVLARVGVHLRIGELTRRLQEANDDLERRVDERTMELARANEELQAEMAERSQADAALVKAKKFLDRVIDTVADPLFVKDRHHLWVLLNEACCNLIGRPRDDLLGHSDRSFFPEAEADVFWEKDELVLLTGDENVNEEQITDSAGNVHTIVTKKTLYVDEGGQRFIVGVIRDITEHKNLEEQLRHAQKMEAVGTLAGGIAHDFNNMLTAITGYGSLLRHRTDEADPRRHCVDEILAAAEKAASLTHNLLAFSRKRICDRKPVDLNKVVQGLQRFLRRVIGETIEIEASLSPHELLVVADCGHLEQLLVNLATNARDAMPTGGRLVIRTEMASRGGDEGPCAVLTVADTGTGMDEETRLRIFDPFFTTKEEGKGTGLGLAIVYGIVKQHDGQIQVRSEPGRGTTFEVVLPLAAQAAAVSEPARHAPPSGGTETILVADDSKDIRDFIKTLLEEFGYRVLLAVDGEETLRLYEQHADRIDLMLLDMVMPRKNGVQVLAEIRALKRPRCIPTILVSGYSPDASLPASDALPGVDFLQKPLTMHSFLSTIRNALDRAKPIGVGGDESPTSPPVDLPTDVDGQGNSQCSA